jgi:hypothetical protein
MLLSPSKGVAYHHIAKTGGISFGRFLSANFPDLAEVSDWPHHSLEQYFSILADKKIDPRKLHIMTTIRNPYDHVVSIYHYWRTKVGLEDQRDHINAARTLPFPEFVQWYVACRHPDCRVYDELLLVDGVVPANVRIVRLEDAAQEVDQFLNGDLGLGIPVNIPISNTTEHRPALSYYTAEGLRLVRQRYHWAFSHRYYG